MSKTRATIVASSGRMLAFKRSAEDQRLITRARSAYTVVLFLPPSWKLVWPCAFTGPESLYVLSHNRLLDLPLRHCCRVPNDSFRLSSFTLDVVVFVLLRSRLTSDSIINCNIELYQNAGYNAYYT